MDKGKAVMGSGRRWAVEFTDNSTSHSSRDIPDPPGFTRASQEQDDSALSKQKKDAEANWKTQKAWEVAQAPFKNLFMMGFMMWMAGSTVHLFSIGITFSALLQPVNALRGLEKFRAFLSLIVQQFWAFHSRSFLVLDYDLKSSPSFNVFEPYKDNRVDLLAPKLVFIALNLVGLGLGIWKLNTLGLLPTHVSDWVSSLPPPQEVEYSGGGIPALLSFASREKVKFDSLVIFRGRWTSASCITLDEVIPYCSELYVILRKALLHLARTSTILGYILHVTLQGCDLFVAINRSVLSFSFPCICFVADHKGK